MNYTTSDVVELLGILFPEPLQDDEYIEIHHGDPTAGKWNQARHCKSHDEVLEWLTSRPDAPPWNYGIHWTTKKLPNQLQLNKRSKASDDWRAWAIICDIEDSKKHVQIASQKAITELWTKRQGDLPEFCTSGAELLIHTGGGIQAICRFTRELGADDLGILLYTNPDRPGALADSYDYDKSRYFDRGSIERGHGARLVGTVNPKYQGPPVVKIIKRLPGAPIDADEYLDRYSTRLQYIRQTDAKKSAAKAKRSAPINNEIGDNAFSVVRQAIDMIRHFGIRKAPQQSGEGYTSVFCPVHDNDKSAAASVTHSNAGDRLHCFSCDFKGDVFDLHQALNNCDRYEALKALAKTAKIPLERYKQAPEEVDKKKKDPDEIVDVGAWLVGNGAILEKSEIYNTEEGLGMRIPFGIGGKIVTLDAPWECWNNAVAFRKAVMCQLLTSFYKYPKSGKGGGPLLWFLEAQLKARGPGAVKDERITDDVILTLRDQLAVTLRTSSSIDPEQLQAFVDSQNRGLSGPDPAPDWWSDCRDFIQLGQTCVLYRDDDRVCLRMQGLDLRIRSEYGGWSTQMIVTQLKKIGWRRQYPVFFGRRIHVWTISSKDYKKYIGK